MGDELEAHFFERMLNYPVGIHVFSFDFLIMCQAQQAEPALLLLLDNRNTSPIKTPMAGAQLVCCSSNDNHWCIVTPQVLI
jgi:hypothetical protein